MLALLAPLLAWPAIAPAQPGGDATYTIRVIDQAGRELTGSRVHIEGTTFDAVTPTSATLAGGPQLVVIEPALQGAAFPDGHLLPAGANSLSRSEMVFFDPMGGDVVLEWRTVTLDAGVFDQGGAPIPGATWGLVDDPGEWGPGPVVLPVIDAMLYPTMLGGASTGYRFRVHAAFEGAPVDLARQETRPAVATTPDLHFAWPQLACTMGVVDATGAPIRGATWAVLGHTYAAGDAIALPVTDDVLFPSLAGALAAGFPMTLFTNTAAGSGNAIFEVTAAGALSPDFVDVNGASFGLRCGVSAFPPLTTGSLAGVVLADGAPRAGVDVTATPVAGGAAEGASPRLAVTDATGAYRFDDVPAGSWTAAVTVPAGYHAVDPATGTRAVEVTAGATAEASFALAQDVAPPPAGVNRPERWTWWRREVRAALEAQGGGGGHGGGKGKGDSHRSPGPQTPLADLAVTYPQAIFDGFAQHPTEPVRIEGVTQIDPDGAGPQPAGPLALADLGRMLQPGRGEPARGVRRELLVVLLNVVSGRLSQDLVVAPAWSPEGAIDLGHAIRRIAGMIVDADPRNDRFARGWARRINSGLGALSWPGSDDAEAVERTLAQDDALEAADAATVAALDAAEAKDGPVLTARPDAAGGSSVRIAFALPEAAPATLEVYDAAGRRVARLYAGDAPAGETAVRWDAAGARPGMYFARIVTPMGVGSAKVLLAR